MFKKAAVKTGVKRPKLAAFAESGSDDEELAPSKAPRLAVPQQSKPDIKIDESAYLYDELYEEIKSEDPRAKQKQRQQKGAVYMDKLLKAKEQRQRDKLAVQGLQVEKEREAEGGLFDDKETFVTDSYKKFKEELADSAANEQSTGRGLDLSALSKEPEENTDAPGGVDEAEENTDYTPRAWSGGLNVVKSSIHKSTEEEMIQFLLKHNTTDEEIRQARERYFERRRERPVMST